MKVKLGTIKGAQSGFIAIMQAQMPIKLAYAVSRNLKKIASEMEDVEKVRMDLIRKYGAPDEKSGGMQVTKENMEVFEKEYGDVLANEVELDLWKLPLSKLSDAGVRLTPTQIVTMEDFIEDDLPPDASPALIDDPLKRYPKLPEETPGK